MTNKNKMCILFLYLLECNNNLSKENLDLSFDMVNCLYGLLKIIKLENEEN